SIQTRASRHSICADSSSCYHPNANVRFRLTSMEITVGITGASGAIYAQRTLVHLAASGGVERINLILSESARTVAMVELGFDLRAADEKKINEWIGQPSDARLLRVHRLDNMAATPSSGSHPQA